MEENNGKATMTRLLDDAKRLGMLYIEDAKLNVAEKVTMLLSAIAIFLICVMLTLVTLVLLAIVLASVLESVIAPAWCYLIVAGFFILLIVLLFVFKTQLLLNPISKFVTRLFLSPNKTKKQ